MKKLLAIVLVVVLLATVSGVALAAKDVTGNGAPSGSHYNLNIIGVPKDKSAPMDNNSGHRIFVKLDGKSKIMLQQGDDFQVLDANATDGPAKFQLPNPASENEGCTKYSVYVRALGKPGGKAKMTTCASAYIEVEPGVWEWVEMCSSESVDLDRGKGKQSFRNVSKELLTICVDIGEGLQRYYLFDKALQDYFWDYDNKGLKLAQLRFYPMETCYEPDEWKCK